MKYLYILSFVCLLISCKKYSDPPPYFEEPPSNVIGADRRVLVIAIDGLNSAALKAAAAPNYTAATSHGKFSWDALSDTRSTDAASWKTLITGVESGKHNIYDSTFLALGGDSHTGGSGRNYPSIFNYILTSKYYQLSTTAIVSWNSLFTRVMPEVRNKWLVNDDQAAKDSTVSVLNKSQDKIILAQFSGPAKTAKDPSSPANFSPASTEYKAALLKVDGYIGEIMGALKNRAGYKTGSEEWLVIIAGTHGGINKTYGGSSNDEVLVPICYYNEKFIPTELTQEGVFATIALAGAGTNAVRAVLNDADAYDLSSAPITYQFKIKGVRNGSYPVFFAKRGPRADGNVIRSSVPGFGALSDGTGVQNFIRGTSDNNPFGAGPFLDDKWHDLAFTYSDSASNRLAKTYLNGVLIATANITANGASWAAFKSAFPLTIGYSQGDFVSSVDAVYSDVKVFNTALTGADILTNLCVKDPLTNHSKKEYLTGYWPCNDGTGGAFRNKVPSAAGKDFIISGNYKWNLITPGPCSHPDSPGAGKLSNLSRTTDIAPMIFYWLGMPINNDWGWSGSYTWFTRFEAEFIKL